MINQVSSLNNVPKSAFSDFSQPQNGYYISAPYIEKVNEKKSHKLGTTLAVSAIVVGFGALALLSGGANKGVAKLLNKWKIQLEKKLSKGTKFEDLYRFSLNRTNDFLSKSESVNNLTTLKDVLFQKFMWGKKGTNNFGRKIHEGITNFFDRISRKTVNSYYNKTQTKFANLTEYFSTLNEKIKLTHPNSTKVNGVLDDINKRMIRVNENLEKGFGINARNNRYNQIQRDCDGLFDFFWDASFSDIRNFKSKNMWQSFIAEDYLIPAKLKMSNEAGLLRQAITHDINDNYKATMKALSNIQKFVNPADTATNDILRNLRSKLDIYKALSGSDEILKREKLNLEIIEELQKLSQCFNAKASKYNYNSQAAKAITDYVNSVENIISKSSKGELQEILTAYKSLLPRKEYLKLKSKVQSAIKSLDKSIDIETNQYFDKARDLRLGSAPTDVLSILITGGAVGYYLNKAENKDEKYSVALKYGIPAIGAVATSLYCTARLVSGGKAMLVGLLSGWIMNKIGEAVDNTRKKYSLDISLINKTLIKSQPDKV